MRIGAEVIPGSLQLGSREAASHSGQSRLRFQVGAAWMIDATSGLAFTRDDLPLTIILIISDISDCVLHVADLRI